MAWYDEAVFYHIYPLGLCGCAHENDGQPTPGAFAKLEAWAAHAAKLGCTAIYIGPLFESGSHEQVVAAPVAVGKTVIILVVAPEVHIAEPVLIAGVLAVGLQVFEGKEVPAHMVEHTVHNDLLWYTEPAAAGRQKK